MKASTIVKWSISVTLGFLLMIPLGRTFDALNLSVFNSWALFRVSFMFTWPALTWVCFRILNRVWTTKPESQ
jgi:hypothetical protein